MLIVKVICPRKVKSPKKLGSKSLVKIWSLTPEILLICTNVSRTRTYVAWTNVIVTVIVKVWSVTAEIVLIVVGKEGF